MTEQHPITPPPELVCQWCLEAEDDHQPTVAYGLVGQIATKAARWGADQELEACCEWLVRNYNYPEAGNPLRTARRPNPPSLKEQALAALNEIQDHMLGPTNQEKLIRLALEALDD